MNNNYQNRNLTRDDLKGHMTQTKLPNAFSHQRSPFGFISYYIYKHLNVSELVDVLVNLNVLSLLKKKSSKFFLQCS